MTREYDQGKLDKGGVGGIRDRHLTTASSKAGARAALYAQRTLLGSKRLNFTCEMNKTNNPAKRQVWKVKKAKGTFLWLSGIGVSLQNTLTLRAAAIA